MKKKIELSSLRGRLQSNKLTKADIKILDKLVLSQIDFEKCVTNAKEKIGDKTVIAKLPFGFDIIK